ncbi:MAG: long-chain fatty acid--CoA ligase [Spirochaetaceae bacterium]|nr:MAG: long-chain fatty acid--CoA ligase [Spirochaetaceae bacterium]
MNRQIEVVSDLFFSTWESHPDTPALGFVGEQGYSYRGSAALIDAVAAKLRADGVEPGERVAILSENSPNWGIAYLAINRCGAVVVPILPDFPATDVATIIEHAEISACFVSQRLSVKAKGAVSTAKTPVYLLETFDRISELPGEADSGQAAAAIVQLLAGATPPVPEARSQNADDLAAIIYTSGTTGHSKGVMLTNRSIVFDVQKASTIPGMRAGDAMISILPLAHTYECTIGFLVPIFMGCSIHYLRRPPSATVLLPALSVVRPHLMLSVPLLIEKIYRQSVLPSLAGGRLTGRLYRTSFGRKLLNRVAGRKLRKTFGGRLYFFGIGGAALSPEVESFLIEARFPYCIGYGLTETSPLIAGANAANQRPRSTGVPIEGIEVRIDNPDAETGEGEILVRGPIVMKGYYRDPERTAEVIDPDGWFHTGDLGVFDDEGRLYIKGRVKNLILGPSGENIYPEAIESIINSFEYVEDSLVFQSHGRIVARIQVNYDAFKAHVKSLADAAAGAASDAAAAVPKGVNDLLKEIRSRVNSRLSAFSRIDSVIEQPEPFEKTPTNKIKRFLYDKLNPTEPSDQSQPPVQNSDE